MHCICEDEECKFKNENLDEILSSQKIIFTPRDTTIGVNEIFHIFMHGSRSINVDLSFGRRNDHLKMVEKIDEAIDKFDSAYEFNVQITKICTIRGRVPRIGRMRNDHGWRLDVGGLIVLTCDDAYENCSSNEICFVSNFQRYIPNLQICDTIESENVELQVVKIVGDYVTCLIRKPGEIYSYQKLVLKQFNELYYEALDEEIEDCNFAIAHNFDLIIAPDVRSAKYYHQLRKLTKGSDIKLMAKIERNLDENLIEKIVEHFHAVLVTLSIDKVLSVSRKLNKVLLSNFPKEQCLTRSSIKLCEHVDGFILKCNGLKEVLLGMDKLEKISSKISKFAPFQEDEKNERPVSNQTKAIVCITNSSKILRNIPNSNGDPYIIVLTKDEQLSKRLNLRRNLISMVYVECEEKGLEDQTIDMMKIALKYGRHMKIFVSEEPVVERFNKN